MAVYVIGDVQGCFLTLKQLLRCIDFNEKEDELIFLGDVINRGPASLEVLRLIRNNPTSMSMVLGNHEIFAIALALNAIKPTRPHTLEALFLATDKDDLIDFLRNQPFIIRRNDSLFVHAGILPSQTIEKAIINGEQLSRVLKSDQAKRFLTRFFEKIPSSCKEAMRHKRELRVTLAYLTLIRMCSSKDTMDLTYKGPLDKAPHELKPWFLLRNDDNIMIYFGHWAALGFYRKNNYTCLDSGCSWGKQLTALRLSDQKVFQVDNCEQKP